MYKPRFLATKKMPWNKGKLIGPKQPLSLKQIWTIRHSLKIDERYRDLALFNLAIDSKLRACDLLNLRVSDVSSDGQINRRVILSGECPVYPESSRSDVSIAPYCSSFF